jgi:opacity protein-like surface antigen
MGQGATRRLLGVVGVLGLAIFLAGQAVAADLTGMLSLGGSIGSSLMIGDSEYRAHARPRLTFDAVFKYMLRPRMAIVGMFGYGWNGYTSEESWQSGLPPEGVDKQTVIAPFTGGLEFRFGEEGWVPYVGAGGGIYMLQLFHERRVAEDPRTQARHRSYDFGLYGRIGIEQFVTEAMSVDYEVLGHAIFSEDREKFPPPSGRDFERYGFDFNAYGGDAQFVQLRAGVRYYWGAEE